MMHQTAHHACMLACKALVSEATLRNLSHQERELRTLCTHELSARTGDAFVCCSRLQDMAGHTLPTGLAVLILAILLLGSTDAQGGCMPTYTGCSKSPSVWLYFYGVCIDSKQAPFSCIMWMVMHAQVCAHPLSTVSRCQLCSMHTLSRCRHAQHKGTCKCTVHSPRG